MDGITKVFLTLNAETCDVSGDLEQVASMLFANTKGLVYKPSSGISTGYSADKVSLAPLFKFTSQTARTWARKQFICVIGMSLTKMAACKKANGSFLQLQGLEGSDLPSAKSLAAVTEHGFSRFAFATYNDIHY